MEKHNFELPSTKSALLLSLCKNLLHTSTLVANFRQSQQSRRQPFIFDETGIYSRQIEAKKPVYMRLVGSRIGLETV